jgi:hypothetical protein
MSIPNENLKKVETLFHTTDSFQNLESIINSNFKISYAKEVFKGRNTHIPMVSFSNVLLFEAKSQINYGDYSIGLTKDWGIKSKVHPVMYTYDESDFENSIQNLRHISEVGMLLEEFSPLSGVVPIRLKSDPEYNVIFNKMLEKLNYSGRQAVMDFFQKAHPSFVIYELYTKKITAQNKKGQDFECFNDREWRFLPNDVIKNFRYYPLEPEVKTEENCKKYKQEIEEHKEFILEKEAYYQNEKLTFELDDLKFIIVKKTNEIERIFDVLFSKYSKESVIDRIQKGHLLVSSYELIFNNF